MSGAVDISQEACERKAAILESIATVSFKEGTPGRDIFNDAAALIRALRAALYAAERERDDAWRHLKDQARKGNQLFMRYQAERDAADATGYARGVRDAAEASWEIPACPFDLIDYDLGPETPCPVCGDLGTWDDENLARASHCKTPAAAILALLPKEKNDDQ